MKTAVLILFAILVGLTPAVAQQAESGNVTIEVVKKQDGQLNVESEIRSAEDMGTLESILRQYGVQDELQDLEPGEEVEVIIRRKKKSAPATNMSITIDRGFDVEVPPMPPAPPAPVTAKRPLLGVYYAADPATNGGLITSVMEGTGAEAANLKAGDIITKVDDQTIDGIKSLQEIIKSHKPGDKVMLTLLRDDKEMRQEATLGVNTRSGNNFEFRGNIDFNHSPTGKHFEWHSDEDVHHKVKESPVDPNRPMLGIYLKENRVIINGEEVISKGEGVEVSGVIKNTAAAEIGLQEGDRVTKVNGANVAGHAGIGEVLKQAKVGDRVTIEYLRGNKKMKGNATLSGWKTEKMNKTINIQKHIDVDSQEDVFEIIRNADDITVIVDDSEESEMVREFRMVVIMEEVTQEEAEALSARSGEEFSGQSDLSLEAFSVGPNPSDGTFSLAFDIVTKGETQIKVLDINGETIYSENLGNFTGSYNKEFDISNFAKGVYFLQVSQNERAFTKKVVTQ